MNYANPAAVYLRLSKDDGKCRSESESISSQRMFLQQYAAENGIEICAEYADDGISGTVRNRSGLQALLRAIEEDKIHTVLVKDLSRLSRDYLHTGELLESWFPMHRVRLIAVCDGVDTGTESAMNDFSPIRAMMDDWYARDISRKVRAAVYARQKAGICTSARLPYGYIKCSGRIVIEPEKAEHIRMIFAEYQRTARLQAVSDYMEQLGIPQPCGRKGHWSTASVQRILRNSAYVGNMYLHRTQRFSYKNSRRLHLPHSEWIELKIPAIVSQDDYNAVQLILNRRQHRHTRPHWLSGSVFCGHCGSRMTVSGDRLLCGGRRRGNGCVCVSADLRVILEQIEEALTADGVSVDLFRLQNIIDHIILSNTQLTVFVNYRKR
ncbi:MAG: recombinase family protein [Oscillospiraceae bacterium]|nr:recombinase family protein [Oscillospiraceae bacterium]